MRWLAFIVAAAALALCGPADALINPQFTPTDLVEQSGLILLLEVTGVDDDDLADAAVKKVLKGELGEGQVSIDLAASAFPNQTAMVRGWIAAGQTQALLFARDVYAPQGGGDYDAAGYLSINGQWLALDAAGAARWDMEQRVERMLGTWAGGTDMLLRAVEYALSDPDADFPVNEGVTWDEAVSGGRVEGKVIAAQAVDLDGSRAAWLFLAGAERDRLFRLDEGKLRDVTAGHNLNSRSAAFTWGDFNGDGRLDLASHGGAALTMHYQSGDGTFAGQRTGALGGGCLSLSAADAGMGRRAGLVAGTGAGPVLVTFSPDGAAHAEPLPTGDAPFDRLGEGGGCLVADLDGDAVPDVLQMFAPAGLFYRGQAPGRFEAPVLTGVAKGEGRYGACLGDFDADGLPDVFVCAENGNQIWQNGGGGRFSPALHRSGEIEYIPRPGGVAAQTGDFNNDGRQDVFLAYWAERKPQLFFNRGFRSFGHARRVDLNVQGLLPQALDGQQAGCLGDFNGDGALDMALVLADGELWVFPRRIEGGPALAVALCLPPGAPHAGPVNIRAWRRERSLGAWVVRAGEAATLVGLQEPGPATLGWRWPDGQAVAKQVIVESGPVRVLLDGE